MCECNCDDDYWYLPKIVPSKRKVKTPKELFRYSRADRNRLRKRKYPRVYRGKYPYGYGPLKTQESFNLLFKQLYKPRDITQLSRKSIFICDEVTSIAVVSGTRQSEPDTYQGT